MSLAFLAGALFLLLVLTASQRWLELRQQSNAEGQLDDALERDCQDAFDEIVLIVRENQHVLGSYHDEAREISREGRARQAAEWMARGCEAIEELAPSYLAALAVLRRWTRALSMIVPPEPLHVYAFQVWRLRGLAAVGLVLHHLLVTGRQRVLLHLHLLGTAFRWALRSLRRSVERLPAQPEEWRQVEALVHDLDYVGDETVEIARRIVHTLDTLDRLRRQRPHRTA